VARREDAILVPPQAIRREVSGVAVYITDGDVVRRRAVETGLAREDAVEISSGLEGSEEVIVVANGDLADGLKISKKVTFKPYK
jgi:multidrug efflux pump subunit AcrA (membrane-fusion protein)